MALGGEVSKRVIGTKRGGLHLAVSDIAPVLLGKLAPFRATLGFLPTFLCGSCRGFPWQVSFLHSGLQYFALLPLAQNSFLQIRHITFFVSISPCPPFRLYPSSDFRNRSAHNEHARTDFFCERVSGVPSWAFRKRNHPPQKRGPQTRDGPLEPPY